MDRMCSNYKKMIAALMDKVHFNVPSSYSLLLFKKKNHFTIYTVTATLYTV